MKKLSLLLLLILLSNYFISQTNTWTVSGSDIFNVNTGNVGVGTNNPQYKLDIFGDARVSNNLFVGSGIITTGTVNSNGEINGGSINVSSNLSVNGSVNFSSLGGGIKFKPIYVTPSGNLVNSLETEPGWIDPSTGFNSCNPYSNPWRIGGNVITGSGYSDISAGTCDNFDFILKANGINRQWIKTDGTIGFGTNIGSNTNGPEYRFKTGVIRLQSGNTYGGPQIIFDLNDNSTPYGDWGIEYTKALPGKDGLNFWKPFGSVNSNNNLFFLADDGTVGVGTDNPSTKFTVDGWAGDGVLTKVNLTSKAYIVFDKTTQSEKFVIYGNGATHIGSANAQIGFANIAIQDQNVALNINNQNINGIKFSSNNNNVKLFTTVNSNFSTSPFTVYADGRTRIGGELTTNTPYLLTVNGKVGAREVLVTLQGSWPDYVFAKNYKLNSLESVKEYIRINKHLPGIPSANEISKNEFGLNMGEMQIKQMEKIEEIYLYLFELKEEMEALKKENEGLKKQIKK